MHTSSVHGGARQLCAYVPYSLFFLVHFFKQVRTTNDSMTTTTKQLEKGPCRARKERPHNRTTRTFPSLRIAHCVGMFSRQGIPTFEADENGVAPFNGDYICGTCAENREQIPVRVQAYVTKLREWL